MEVIHDVTRYLFIKTSMRIHVFVGLTETQAWRGNYFTVISSALHSNLSVDITIHQSTIKMRLLAADLVLFSCLSSLILIHFLCKRWHRTLLAAGNCDGGTMSPLVGRRHHRLLSLRCRHCWTRRPRAICARRLQGCQRISDTRAQPSLFSDVTVRLRV